MGGILGGGPEKVEETEAERMQTRTAANRWNNRGEDGFRALEADARKDVNRSLAPTKQGMAGADLAKMEAQALLSAGRPNAVTIGRSTDATASSMQTASNAVFVEDQQFRDNKALGVINTGNNKMKNADATSSAMLNNDQSRSFTAAQSAMTRSNAKAQAIGQVAGAGAAKYDSWRQEQKLNKLMKKD